MTCHGCKDKFRCLTMIDKREFEQHKIQCFGFKFTTAPRHTRDFISKNYDVYEQDSGQAPPVVKIKTETNSSGTYMDLATKEDEMLLLAITSDYQYEVSVKNVAFKMERID